MENKNIRNFSIIAHIDHGKSTLSDRLLEKTNTVEKRKMKEQFLDVMDLERERGITIKMQPVRMEYEIREKKYILNLIDTPGHIDFSYEVSRALAAVEGVVLLVDATQGIQAQTISTFEIAKDQDLPIIPVINKIDLPNADIDRTKDEITKILDCNRDEILSVSAKTGDGVGGLLEKIVKKIPEPKIESKDVKKAFIFDVEYSNHQGVIVYVRILSGFIKKQDSLVFLNTKEKFKVLSVGIFSPEKKEKDMLFAGEIGYIVTGIKKPNAARVGDTISTSAGEDPVPGFKKPKPVVFASIYPESKEDLDETRLALARLSLSDSSISYEEEQSGSLGRGFRIGVLGMLHLEIVTERLKREFGLSLIVTTPSISYSVVLNNGETTFVYSPHKFPNEGEYRKIYEPWISVEIISPKDYVGSLSALFYEHEGVIGNEENMGVDRVKVHAKMPLRELMRGFFDELKGVSSGYASLSYVQGKDKEAEVARLDFLVAGEIVPALSRVVSKRRIEREARESVEKLYKVLPRQQFVVKIQGSGMGRIISSKTLSALKKDVTAKLYGGDITRKMKLRKKQKEGKKKMRERGRVNIPQDVFIKMMKKD